MAQDLQGRHALVTGAARGIGAAIARRCDESRYVTGSELVIDRGVDA